jgi:hypothetical protein
MIARILAIVAGALLLAAVAHVNVMATGGYGTPQSWVTLAVAFGVACAAICSGMAWSAGRWQLAIAIVISIVAGEAYGLISTAERLIVSREAAQAPLREGQREHAKAVQRVAAAQRAVANAPTTSKRLEDAKNAKAEADQAVIDKSAERGCRENCRQLLQAQVDAAAVEVTSAQAALDAAKVKAEGELITARTALASIKAPQSATPLADRIGVSAWIIDLLQSALGSIAANGLACCLLLFGAHHPVQRVEIVTPRRAPQKTPGDFEASPTHGSGDELKQHAAKFAVECLRPDPDGEVDLLALRDQYGAWCPADRRVSAAKIGRALADLFKGAGIPIATRNGKLVAIGVTLRQPDGAQLLPLESR